MLLSKRQNKIRNNLMCRRLIYILYALLVSLCFLFTAVLISIRVSLINLQSNLNSCFKIGFKIINKISIDTEIELLNLSVCDRK